MYQELQGLFDMKKSLKLYTGTCNPALARRIADTVERYRQSI